MKIMRKIFEKHSRTLQMISAMLIVCLAFTDASLYNKLVSGGSECDYEIIEDHPLETALADGKYDEKNSDSESGQSDYFTTLNAKKYSTYLKSFRVRVKEL